MDALQTSLDGHRGDVFATGANDELLVAAGDLEPDWYVTRHTSHVTRHTSLVVVVVVIIAVIIIIVTIIIFVITTIVYYRHHYTHMFEVSRDALSPECSQPSASMDSWRNNYAEEPH